MSYRTAVPGQVIYYSPNHWTDRRPVVLVRYYKLRPDLKNNNCAIVDERGFHFSVDIKDLYKSAE